MVYNITVVILVGSIVNDSINDIIGCFFGGYSFTFTSLPVGETFRNLNCVTACIWEMRPDAPGASCRIEAKLPIARRSPQVAQ